MVCSAICASNAFMKVIRRNRVQFALPECITILFKLPICWKRFVYVINDTIHL